MVLEGECVEYSKLLTPLASDGLESAAPCQSQQSLRLVLSVARLGRGRDTPREAVPRQTTMPA